MEVVMGVEKKKKNRTLPMTQVTFTGVVRDSLEGKVHRVN